MRMYAALCVALITLPLLAATCVRHALPVGQQLPVSPTAGATVNTHTSTVHSQGIATAADMEQAELAPTGHSGQTDAAHGLQAPANELPACATLSTQAQNASAVSAPRQPPGSSELLACGGPRSGDIHHPGNMCGIPETASTSKPAITAASLPTSETALLPGPASPAVTQQPLTAAYYAAFCSWGIDLTCRALQQAKNLASHGLARADLLLGIILILCAFLLVRGQV